MNLDLVNQIANAVLYEGYILYPYRRSAVKNQQRWNFGVLYPRTYAEAQTGHDAWSMQTECLALVNAETKINVRLRFLHLVNREIGRLHQPIASFEKINRWSYDRVEELHVMGQTFQSWQEAIEREVTVGPMRLDGSSITRSVPFNFPAHEAIEPIGEGESIVGVIVREQKTVAGEISISASQEVGALSRLRIIITNQAELDRNDEERRAEALGQSLLSAHVVVRLAHGEFISLLDPPDEYRAAAADCNNIGCWPVLVGQADERDTMLASPIILYDYPQIAAQSSGDLFDGTEIDEILSLRIMTLTDDEKREMQTSDERGRKILERTEALPLEQFMKMHGVLKTVNSES
jgi:hydrogenase maturation protease